LLAIQMIMLLGLVSGLRKMSLTMVKKLPRNMVKALLREGISFSPPFTVSERPHKAKLDQNEAPFDLPDDVKTVLLDKLKEYQWNRYPQPSIYVKVKEAFAEVIGFSPENIILTMGGDQLIQGTYLIAGGHNRKALIFEPTYPMFSHAAKFNQTNVTRIQLTADEVVTKDHINLFIARSTSKSCLAGIRLGYGIGHSDVINAMETIFTAPYHLSCLQLVIAKHFNLIQPHLKDLSDIIIAERERVATQFKEMGISFIPSQGNFILFKVNNPPVVFRQLAESGVRIRSLHTIPGLSDYVRVTIGKKEENDLFLEKLRTLLVT
ncbi:hypothetical protein LCGC14_3041900, partial [marine sediment metagenome]